MRFKLFLVILLVAGSAIAGDVPPSMPIFLPQLPAGVNPVTYPVPRLEWLRRVKNNNENAHKEANAIELIFDGASITEGWQGPGNPVWIERYGKLHAFDFGISGDCIQNVLWRLAHGQVDGLRPRLIAIMVGTNNLYSNTAEEIAEGLKAVVTEYQSRCPGSVILLQGIFPCGQKPDTALRKKAKDVNRIISKLGDGEKVIVIDFGDKFLNPDGTISPEVMPDFTHPTLKGYQIWADAIQPIISTYFPER